MSEFDKKKRDHMPEGTLVMVADKLSIIGRKESNEPIIGTLWYWRSDKEAVVMLASGHIVTAFNVFPLEEQI